MPPAWHDHAAAIVVMLFARHHLEKYRKQDEYIPVCSGILRDTIHDRDCPMILAALLGKGVIESDGTHWAASRDRRGRCTGYRLHEQY